MAILTSRQAREVFGIRSNDTLRMLFKQKGSPAFKVGTDWRVDEEEFKKFLKEQSEEFKG